MDLTTARRILILGICGGGKSTFARRLGEASGLPVVHLDREFWRPGWIETPREQFREHVAELCRADCWIMDGHYGSCLDIRLAQADAVIYFDTGRALSLWSVVRRWRRNRGQSRPDMAQGCPEKVDWEFIRFVLGFSRRQRPRALAVLAAHPETPCQVIRKRRQLETLLTQFDR